MSVQSVSKPHSLSDFKKSLKGISPASTISGLVSSMAYIEIFDVLFGFVLIFALIKDLSDIFISLIPFVGWAIALFLSVFCAIFVFLLMLPLGAGSSKSMAKRLVINFCGTFVDTIPFVSFFPTETAVVIITFFMILKERKEKAGENKQKDSTKNWRNQEAYV